VSPSNPKIQRNTAIQLTAVGTFSDGSTATNLAGLAWTSSNARVAPVHGGGWVFGKKNGTTTITASVAAVKGTTTVAVYGAALVSMTITPANAIVPVGATQQFTATALFTDGSQQDITNHVHHHGCGDHRHRSELWHENSNNPADGAINSRGRESRRRVTPQACNPVTRAELPARKFLKTGVPPGYTRWYAGAQSHSEPFGFGDNLIVSSWI
jgi:hypothetical protein